MRLILKKYASSAYEVENHCGNSLVIGLEKEKGKISLMNLIFLEIGI